MTPFLFGDIEHEEGRRLRAYRDSGGVLTIGVGHTGPDVREGMEIKDGRATELLHLDAGSAVAQLDQRLSWWRKLSDVRQDVLVQMVFQMGLHGTLGFTRALLAMRTGMFDRAADAMLDSDWAQNDSPARAKRMASQMRTNTRAWAWADPKTPDIGPASLMASISHPSPKGQP